MIQNPTHPLFRRLTMQGREFELKKQYFKILSSFHSVDLQFGLGLGSQLKTFYACKLQMSVTEQSGCPWQAFPAFQWLRPEPILDRSTRKVRLHQHKYIYKCIHKTIYGFNYFFTVVSQCVLRFSVSTTRDYYSWARLVPIQVEPLTGFHCQGKLLPLIANIRLG